LKTDNTKLAADTIRMLAADAIQKANSGHPGLPMGAADMACVLWTKFLNHTPDDGKWLNRDRFVLSAGHGSMLLYSLLHLSGYDLSIEDLKSFRQWKSKTPGHPELGQVGVETTTGPLGQGFANGVGMALASKLYASRFNNDNFTMIDHFIYGLVGDGDLMEGITSEAASIAGHLQLGNVIYLYDDNSITIEGGTHMAFSDNVPERFAAYGWQVISIDGHDHAAIEAAIESAKLIADKPSLIVAKTKIGFGSPNKEGTAAAHGAPLGADEIRETKKNLGLPADKDFYVPAEVYKLFQSHSSECEKSYAEWKQKFTDRLSSDAGFKESWQAFTNPDLPENLEELLRDAIDEKPAATRIMGGQVIQKAAELLPGLIGGSADLSPSTKTDIKGVDSIGPGKFSGKNIHYGIREHAMASLMNGIALYDHIIPFGSTFFVFSDYLRPAIRLSALMKLQVIYIFTHDSLFVGEDGPTHQPVEHLAALRTIPNLILFRPADRDETASAWAWALRSKNQPAAICLTRQNVTTIKRPDNFDLKTIQKGGYIVQNNDNPDVVIVATGSELQLALDTAAGLEQQGRAVRVVSMPSLDLFLSQDDDYRHKIIPESDIPVIIIEAGIKQGWAEISRSPLLFLGMDDFGSSGPSNVLAKEYGFNAESTVQKSTDWLNSMAVR